MVVVGLRWLSRHKLSERSPGEIASSSPVLVIGTSVNPIIRTWRYALYVNFVIWKGCIVCSYALEIFKFQYNNTFALEMLWW